MMEFFDLSNPKKPRRIYVRKGWIQNSSNVISISPFFHISSLLSFMKSEVSGFTWYQKGTALPGLRFL